MKAHVSAILNKFKVGNRTQMVIATSKVDLEAILSGKDVCAPAAGNGSDQAGGRKKNGGPNDRHGAASREFGAAHCWQANHWSQKKTQILRSGRAKLLSRTSIKPARLTCNSSMHHAGRRT